MEFTQPPNSKATYQVIEPVFFNDAVIGVLDGKYVLGTVSRKLTSGFRIEYRTSFKHPVIGAIIGLGLTGVPLQAIAGDPLGLWWLTLASPMRVVGSVCMTIFGLYFLWGVIRRKDEPWLILVTTAGERAFPLNKELSEEATAVLDLLTGSENMKK